jgi:hypothetical protein
VNCEQGVELGTRLAEAEAGEGGGGVDIDAEAVR